MNCATESESTIIRMVISIQVSGHRIYSTVKEPIYLLQENVIKVNCAKANKTVKENTYI